MAGSGNGIVIVSAARTPVGSFNGSLSSVPASDSDGAPTKMIAVELPAE